MSLIEILRDLMNQTTKLDVNHLPSQGLFYPDDFELKIRKADIADIIEYEHLLEDNIYSMIVEIKKIVRKNVILSDGYSFQDLKSIDIIFIFFEIVKFTNNKPLQISFYDDEIGNICTVDVNSKTFNYFDFSPYLSGYNSDTRELVIDGYRFSVPSIGVEDAITQFLVSKYDKPDTDKYTKCSYDFRFFVGNKDNLSFPEIENLILVFNEDIGSSELKSVKKIISYFEPLVAFTLKKDGKVIEVQSKIDLTTIWK